jgi:hypothetical protein
MFTFCPAKRDANRYNHGVQNRRVFATKARNLVFVIPVPARRSPKRLKAQAIEGPRIPSDN